MKTNEIKELIKILEDSQLNELSYKEDNFEISLKKALSYSSEPSVITSKQQLEVSDKKKNTIKSPLVGVYYGRPSPEEDSFVKVGDQIQVGDTLCIIEAMKVMNEIKSDKDGLVKEILVGDGDLVSFDQDLLVID